MSNQSLQELFDQLSIKIQKAENGQCVQCGASEWIKSGLPGGPGQPGIWDWECECCGRTQGYSPYLSQEKGQ